KERGDDPETSLLRRRSPFSRKRRGECPIKTRIGRNGKGASAAESRSRSTCFGRKL
ncbi:unnamed protein product, partial [Musa acuminata var. zebrina]